VRIAALRALAVVFAVGGCSEEAHPRPVTTAGPTETFVEVDNGVRLAVLDWGGSGSALILLAGATHSAHIFEELAPHFTDQRRVLGITRRRVGHSDAPAAEFGLGELVSDIVAVMDAFEIPKADFIAHSFGGAELSYLAIEHPGRVRKAVYLDAGWDFFEMYNADDWWEWPEIPMTAADSASPQAVADYFARTWGPLFPLSEIRATHRFDESGKLVRLDPEVGDMFPGMIRDRLRPIDASAIQVPVLSVRAVPRDIYDFFMGIDSYGPTNRRRAEEAFARWMNVVIPASARFAEEVPNAEVLVVPRGHHDIVTLQPESFVGIVRAFLAK